MLEIKAVVSLKFDPEKSGNPEIRKVFANELARTLWLGIKQGHIVRPRFNKDCLHYAVNVRRAKERGELTPGKLLEIIKYSVYSSPEGRDNALAFAAKLMPFIKGEKTMSYEIVA